MARKNSVSIQQKIGLRIRELRNKAKYSQENLGHFSELDRTYINSVENGHVLFFLRMCAILKVTMAAKLFKSA